MKIFFLVLKSPDRRYNNGRGMKRWPVKADDLQLDPDGMECESASRTLHYLTPGVLLIFGPISSLGQILGGKQDRLM